MRYAAASDGVYKQRHRVLEAGRNTLCAVLAWIHDPLLSTASEDNALLKIRKKTLRDENSRELFASLRDTIHNRTFLLYQPVTRIDSLAKLDGTSEDQNKEQESKTGYFSPRFSNV